MEKKMSIIETTVITRANTTVSWPGEGYQVSANNLFPTRENIDYTKTTSISDNNLIKTSVVTWTSLEKCLEVKLSATNSDIENWISTTHCPGITSVRTIETV